ncbi:MAG: hypothetical protein IJB90_03490 [Clostridia bacterium]|nr:hypothetical protein [Clostridia bacterium]
MPSCLGLYIENNIIKYAKISKERENIRIESFGMKFYDNIDETIKQIISETYSYKTPIAVNLSDEKYMYAHLFNLLNKKDLEKAVDTEFDFYCNEVGKNRNALEYRRLLFPNLEDRDKTTSLYAYTEKSNIVGKLQVLDSYKVTEVVPLPLSIVNLNTFIDKRNSVIVNIEKNTSVTTIVNGQIQKVDIIETGMKEILDSIMLRENSYAKAYEICKNTTIYTTQGRNLQVEENEYMEDIMPVLYKIVENVKQIIDVNQIDINDIYITGLAAAINNVDLYFQENFPDKKCEILSPFFINKSNVKLNIKDYIEVNSAISLALQGVGIGTKEINFKRTNTLDKISKQMNIDLGSSQSKKEKDVSNTAKSEKTKSFSDGFAGALDNIEKMLIRTGASILILIIIYIVFVKTISGQINKKEQEVDSYIADTNQKLETVTKYTSAVNDKTRHYESLIAKIDEANQKLTESYARKNSIPNLLSDIESVIPKGVQLLSIKNPTTKTVQIEAQAKEYEQLGYFISKIKVDGILANVKSTESVKQNEYIKITIEGDLVY